MILRARRFGAVPVRSAAAGILLLLSASVQAQDEGQAGLRQVQAPPLQNCTIGAPQKIGIGAYPVHGEEQLAGDLSEIGASWFYTWQANSSSAYGGFVPMIWSGDLIDEAAGASGDVMLAFNEPDWHDQADMTVEEALSFWPALMRTGKRLGSPATTSGNETGPGSWLGRFMNGAKERGLRIDFIAVHDYASEPDVAAFRRRLERIHDAYGRPIWVTEWALADFSDAGRFSRDEQLQYLEAGSEMMDDLPFVERHAWFGIYDGLDDWHLSSGLVEKGERTALGEAYRRMVTCSLNRGAPQE